MTLPSSYLNLEKAFQEYSNLEHIGSILSWDESVAMPSGGGEARAQAMAFLFSLINRHFKDPRLLDWVQEAQHEDDLLNEWQKANLKEMKRKILAQQSVPAELVEEMSLANTRAQQAWRDLRGKNDWTSFLPYLEKVVNCAQQVAQVYSDVYELPLYDAMMQEYEPGLTTKDVDPIFNDLRQFLPGFLDEVLEKQKMVAPAKGHYPIEEQKKLALKMMEVLGFDFNRGRLDVSHHPFCGGVAQDVRLTTRYKDEDFIDSLMSVLHETGHAKYEQNRPQDWLHQPVGGARGMAVHESQSLLHEMQIGRGPHLIQFMTPLFKQYMGSYCADSAQWTPDYFSRLLTRVERGFIRVAADEVTYPLHIILRYELEKALIHGDLKVRDLPGAWNEKMTQYLGLSTLGNDKDGCMQDVHWPGGAFGYFPSYTLGALIAAQLFAHMKTVYPSVESDLTRGDFQNVNHYLSDKVWSQGSKLHTQDMLIQATGEGLSTKAFKNHLQKRYLSN